MVFGMSMFVAMVHENLHAQIYADVETSMGDFTIQLSYTTVPRTVANFIRLAEGTCNWVDYATGQIKQKPYYNGVTFHRVIPGLMSQTGSRKGDGTDGPGYNFRDEFSGGMHTDPYVVSMANSGPNTNGAQFFITAVTRPQWNGVHSVFGKVILYDAPDDGTTDDSIGRQVCSAINTVSTNSGDKPLVDVVIQKITIRREGAAAEAFDEDAQGLPELSAPPVTINHGGTTVDLIVDTPSSSLTNYSYSYDLSAWQEGEGVYRDNTDIALSAIDVSTPSSGQEKLFFNTSQVTYDPSLVLWPRLLTGRTLTLTTIYGSLALTFTSESGGSSVLTTGGDELYSSFTITDFSSDGFGDRKYIFTGFESVSGQLRYVLRVSHDTVFPAYLQGRHSGTRYFYNSTTGILSNDGPTSGTLTLTR